MSILDLSFEVSELNTLPVLYKAVKTIGFGVGEDNSLIAGLKLVVVSEEYEWYDAITDEIANMGAEAQIVLPDGGLEEGAIYSVHTKVTSTDWETGYADDWQAVLTKEMN